MGNIYGGMIDLIGNTPLVEMRNLAKDNKFQARLLVKVEFF